MPNPTQVTVFSTQPHDELYLTEANATHQHDLRFVDTRLTPTTAVLAAGSDVACLFVNDDAGAASLEALSDLGVAHVALRSAGFNHVALETAARLGLPITRVPDYSPDAVAEHCVGLILSLNRKIHRAYGRVRELNFTLDGLLGFDLRGKTVGIVGTGKIGARFAEIISAFGTHVIAADPVPSARCVELGVTYLPIEQVLANSDIVTLHCPLTPETLHLINHDHLELMRDGAMLINTSRGALIDTSAVIAALKTGKLGYLGLDVYEEEAGLFFEDLSERVVHDDVFARLLTFPNVLITGHQGFFTIEALRAIAATTLDSISAVASGQLPSTLVTL